MAGQNSFDMKGQAKAQQAEQERPLSGLLSRAPETAILVGIDMPGQDQNADWPLKESLDELEQLATTAGVRCVDRVMARLAKINPGTLLGSGKVREIADLVAYHGSEAVIFDLELTPGQHRALERELDTHVLDRTALILIIFGQRARTREGRLQVELAQVEYDLPRIARQWSHLSRQKGSVQQRGEGEKQIEVDRRLLRRQKDQLEEELEHVRTHRQLHRDRRKTSGAPVVALVGYTNAGKSTLMNALAGAGVLAENRLFATLDPVTRRVRLDDDLTVLVTDTVGFIQKLPASLVAAFRATLEELEDADLLLHVIDITDPNAPEQTQVVEETLASLGVAGKPRLMALNKVDRLRRSNGAPVASLDDVLAVADAEPLRDDVVPISAERGWGLDTLRERIAAIIRRERAAEATRAAGRAAI